MNLDLDHAIEQLRTPVGFTVMATAGIGVTLAAHWPPLLIVMVPFYVISLLVPEFARKSVVWFAVTAIWIGTVIVFRSEMEDHVYLWVAWSLAIAIGLLDLRTFVHEVARHGRLLIGAVFAFATVWKLTSGSFLSGAALWTLGLNDSRLGPLFRFAGVSQDDFDRARAPVDQVAAGQLDSFDIALSSYSSTALVLLAFGTIVIEALVAVTHLAPNDNWLARLRLPMLVLFGLVTYSIVPVLAFAALLSVISLTIADFNRRAVVALAVMMVIAAIRFATL